MSVDLHLVLVTPEIPANTGNIVRTCAVTGVHLHLIEPLGFALNDKMAKRAGMDYWTNCSLQLHLTFEQVENEFTQAQFHFLSARARQSFFERTIRPGDVIVLGPETTGLSTSFLEHKQRKKDVYSLPMPGSGRSLNLSTAAGIVIYESLRQLGFGKPKQGQVACLS